MTIKETKITEHDEKLLRATFRLAVRAVASGNHPFGAILANEGGEVLLEAENTVETEKDVTAHAETKIVQMASQRGYGASLGNMTLYASTEPCPMCSGAIYWSGINRVVYGLSQERLYSIYASAGGHDSWIVHCRDLLSHGDRSIEVLGPALEDEAAKPHEGFWQAFLLSDDG